MTIPEGERRLKIRMEISICYHTIRMITKNVRVNTIFIRGLKSKNYLQTLMEFLITYGIMTQMKFCGNSKSIFGFIEFNDQYSAIQLIRQSSTQLDGNMIYFEPSNSITNSKVSYEQIQYMIDTIMSQNTFISDSIFYTNIPIKPILVYNNLKSCIKSKNRVKCRKLQLPRVSFMQYKYEIPSHPWVKCINSSTKWICDPYVKINKGSMVPH